MMETGFTLLGDICRPLPRRRLLSAVCGALLLSLPAAAGDSKGSHGISIFGDLKYAPDFKHFEYVNPNAPKGGKLRLPGRDSFDTLNPFILKGVIAQGLGLLFDTLMTRAMDEPDALYGLVAETVEVDDKRKWMAFNLRKEARWHDGTPLTAEDVAFTFNTLIKEGHPVYRILYGQVRDVKVESRYRVRFNFKPGAKRGLPVKLAALPVLSRRYYKRVPFQKTTMQPPLGSGPYNITDIEPGRSITYKRDKAYWGRNLPVNRGRFNFDVLQWDYFRDRGIAREAFFADEYDFHEEFVSRAWAKQYDKPPVNDGFIVREVMPDGRTAGVQAFFMNLRRKKFADPRVREALNLAFDFDWTNAHLFFGLYKRTNSMFENSVYAAHEPPSDAELKLLDPYRDEVPAAVFEKPYKAPSSATDGIRKNLLKAAKLLREAGWRVKDHKIRVDKKGEPLEIEFLIASASFARILGPYIRNLERLGIHSTIRVVDSANFKNRRDKFDFDIAMLKLPQFLTPGEEQRGYFGSHAAKMTGSKNISGLKSPAVDAMIDRIVNADSRDELTVAARAMDRVLMWNNFIIPHWYKGRHNVAYWNRFERPAKKPLYDLGVVDTWWFNPRKAKLIEADKAPPPMKR